MSYQSPELSVCVLLYGSDDYCFRLAQRVINPALKRLGAKTPDFRFGLNAVGDATREYVAQAVFDYFPNALVVDCPENIGKYPMMRRLLYDRPLESQLTMWFDDDSCIVEQTNVDDWFARIQQQMHAYTMLGSVYRERFVGNQVAWIKHQPWYNDKEPGAYTQFAAGGWWVMQSSTLNMFDWPPGEPGHKGVDVMLGELLRQHNLPLGHFRDGVMISANDAGVESQSTRSGNIKHDIYETPIGFFYSGAT